MLLQFLKLKYHKIFQNNHIHINVRWLFNKPQTPKSVVKQEALPDIQLWALSHDILSSQNPI